MNVKRPMNRSPLLPAIAGKRRARIGSGRQPVSQAQQCDPADLFECSLRFSLGLIPQPFLKSRENVLFRPSLYRHDEGKAEFRPIAFVEHKKAVALQITE